MKKIFLLFLIVHCSLTIDNCLSQVTQQWAARYNRPGNGDDGARTLAIDGSGNVYVTGESDLDYATIKYNSSGDSVWVARYNGPGNSDDAANSIAVDGSGNVYVTGESWGGSGTHYDYATIKYNSSGVQQWVQRYNGPQSYWDGASSIAVDGSGNVYVTGYSMASGQLDYATLKYNSSGDSLWVRRYNGPGNNHDHAYSLAIDGSGNVYVTGESTGSGTDYDYATIKYNSSGVQQWVQLYNGPGNSVDRAWSLAVDGSGNVYVTGLSTGSGTGWDYATIKYNSSGDSLWVKRYNGPGNDLDAATSLAIDGSGNVYVTGWGLGSGTSWDFATIKYNSSGIQLWVARYNGPANGADGGHSLAVDGSGNVYVTGDSQGSGTGRDYATIKYNSSGDSLWVARYNGSGNGNDVPYSLAVDSSGNVYVTGESWGSGTNYYDYATIKYSQLVGITPASNQIPKAFRLQHNYPNPFNPTTNLRFEISDLRFVKLVIYDALGREVTTLVNEQLKPGSYEVDWDAADFPSGVYYYRLSAGGYVNTKKMMLVK